MYKVGVHSVAHELGNFHFVAANITGDIRDHPRGTDDVDWVTAAIGLLNGDWHHLLVSIGLVAFCILLVRLRTACESDC